MAVLPRTLFWQRLDDAGAEVSTFDDRRGLTAHGVQLGSSPVPYSCRYELYTDEEWITARFEATAEGAGWRRTVKLERAAGRWRVTTSEQGNLDAALRAVGQPSAPFPGSEDPDRLAAAFDVDLAASPLTNTLPIRRLGLHHAAVGRPQPILAVWVLVPSLAVVPSEQVYTLLEDGRIRYASGNFTSELEVDETGFVVRYPKLATRA